MQNSLKLGAFITVVGLCLLLVAVLVVTKASVAITSQSLQVAAQPVPLPEDTPSLVRGQHLVQHVTGCVGCHGADLSGKALVESRNFGTIAGSNLTALEQPVVEWVRAIRYGVGTDNHALWLMPAPAYGALSDHDLGAIIAYIRALPDVYHELPSKRLGPFGRVAVVTGRATLVHAQSEAHPLDVPEGPTAAYGEYLAQIGRCTMCHGSRLDGTAPHSGVDPGDIRRGALQGWQQADFARALREGRRPDGSRLDATMPWAIYAGMTDIELTALWSYIQTL